MFRAIDEIVTEGIVLSYGGRVFCGRSTEGREENLTRPRVVFSRKTQKCISHVDPGMMNSRGGIRRHEAPS